MTFLGGNRLPYHSQWPVWPALFCKLNRKSLPVCRLALAWRCRWSGTLDNTADSWENWVGLVVWSLWSSGIDRPIFTAQHSGGPDSLWSQQKDSAVTMLKLSDATLCLCLLTVLESTVFLGTCSPANVQGFGKLSTSSSDTLLSFLSRFSRFHLWLSRFCHSASTQVEKTTSSTAVRHESEDNSCKPAALQQTQLLVEVVS